MERAEVDHAREKLQRGLLDPDSFFADRGFHLSSYEADGEWWTDLSSQVRRYGRGPTEVEAKQRAVRRWMAEEEHPDLQRRPDQPLP